jgi:hypothetical protein
MHAQPARPATTVIDLAGRLAAHSSGTQLHPVRLIIGAVVIAALVYAVACAVTPFAQCRRCDGNGKYRKPRGRAWHPCKHCKGSGHRLRWGRHVTNYLHRTHHHANRSSKQRDRLTARRPR